MHDRFPSLINNGDRCLIDLTVNVVLTISLLQLGDGFSVAVAVILISHENFEYEKLHTKTSNTKNFTREDDVICTRSTSPYICTAKSFSFEDAVFLFRRHNISLSKKKCFSFEVISRQNLPQYFSFYMPTSPRHNMKPTIPERKYDTQGKILNWSQLWPEAKELETLNHLKEDIVSISTVYCHS